MGILRSKFLVLDGPEGAGKSTQMHMLQTRLEAEGAQVAIFRDPGSTRIGERIRAILLNPDHSEMSMRCEMLLYMAARAQMLQQNILPALRQGQVVISDRFVSSTLAYQLGGDGLTADEIRRVADIAISGRWPDLTLVLDVPVEISEARVRPKFSLFPEDPSAGLKLDRIEQRPTEYHRQVRRNYLSQAELMPEHYRVIDASPAPQIVHEAIWSAVLHLR